MADDLTIAVELAWQLGWEACEQAMADLLADRPAPLPVPTRTREQRIARELAAMERWSQQIYSQAAAGEVGPGRPWRCL